MSQHYRDTLDYELGARIVVEFATRGGEVVDYVVVLTIDHDGVNEIVRTYDGTHGVNDIHRHIRTSGKASVALAPYAQFAYSQ
jgi:hypothetical protein